MGFIKDGDGEYPILDATLESVVEGKARIVKVSKFGSTIIQTDIYIFYLGLVLKLV